MIKNAFLERGVPLQSAILELLYSPEGGEEAARAKSAVLCPPGLFMDATR
jgi:hypothetical protein